MDWINSLRKESVCSSRLRKQTNNPPRPPQNQTRGGLEVSSTFMQGTWWPGGCMAGPCLGGSREGLVLGKSLTSISPPPRADPTPCLKVKKSSNSIAARKRVCWVEMLVFSPVFGFLLLLVAVWVSWVPGWMGPGRGVGGSGVLS